MSPLLRTISPACRVIAAIAFVAASALALPAGAQVSPPAPRRPAVPAQPIPPAPAPRPAPPAATVWEPDDFDWSFVRDMQFEAIGDLARLRTESNLMASQAFDMAWEAERAIPEARRQMEFARAEMFDARTMLEGARVESMTFGERWPDGVYATVAGAAFETVPREAWAQNDPADSLYRRARELLNAGSHTEAAALFARIATDYPQSQYAPDALYWEAFARYRVGRTDQMRLALASLERQRTQYPRAATGSDANALATRIRGTLASGGDAAAQRALEGQLAYAGSAGYARTTAASAASVAGSATAIAGATRTATAPVAGVRPAGTRPTANCDAGDLAVRIEALNALSKLESANITPTLNAVLARRDECSAGLRRQALILLSRQGTPEAWAQLRRSATDDPDAGVRRQAVNFLGRAPADVAIPALAELARGGSDEGLQRDAVAALGSVDDPRARQMLRDLVTRTDGRESIRESAISALGRDRSGENATWLRGQYARLDSRRLREQALTVIASSGLPDNDRWLLTVSQDANESMELRASALARSLRGTTDVAAIARLYDGLREPQLRARVITALRSREEPAATDKLLAIARQDSDPTLRRAAISALASKKDPRTERLLLEIINP